MPFYFILSLLGVVVDKAAVDILPLDLALEVICLVVETFLLGLKLAEIIDGAFVGGFCGRSITGFGRCGAPTGGCLLGGSTSSAFKADLAVLKADLGIFEFLVN
ncbi:MAG: hypothetical protein HN348_34465, partial [Proteobacteria bacterium]|nr:hypothetical protein [Pseudomonadota bacterium]